MNFFDLYNRAGRRYLAASSTPIHVTPRLRRELSDALGEVLDAFYRPQPITYSNLQRLAYSFHYAPKHATIWELGIRGYNSRHAGSLRFNCIGPGPGSEIFGLLEANRPASGSVVHVCCLETEPGWRGIFDAACAEYYAWTGVQIVRTDATSARDLWRGALTLGSLVVSDVVRHGEPAVGAFMATLNGALRVSPGFILENMLYPAPGGVSSGVPELLGVGTPWQYYLPQRNWDVQGACTRAMNMVDAPCRREVPYEPKMVLIPWNFR